MNVTTPNSLLPSSFNDTQSLLNNSTTIHNSSFINTTIMDQLLQNLATTLAEELLNDTVRSFNTTASSDINMHRFSNTTSFNSTMDDPDEDASSSLQNGIKKMNPAYSPVHKVVVPSVCVMGIVLNVVNLLVLTERCLKESPYTYLTAMAVLCLATLTMTLLQMVCVCTFRYNYYCFAYTYHVYYPCVNICVNSTMWLTATLTIERFLFVKHPLWARAKCDRRSAKIKICVVILLMVVMNIPRFLMYKVVPNREAGPGTYRFAYKAFRLSWFDYISSWMYCATMQIIPMTILCIFNSYLVYAVHRARRLRKQLHIRNNMEAEWSREQTRLTITLIAIVFFFLVCTMPSAFSDIHVAYTFFGAGQTRKEFRISRFYRLLQIVTNLLVYIQLGFNFVPFSAFNDKFLAVSKQMLRRWSARARRVGNGNRGGSTIHRVDAVRRGRVGRRGRVEITSNNNNNNNKLQLRSSTNSTSSSKDTLHTKRSLLETIS